MDGSWSAGAERSQSVQWSYLFPFPVLKVLTANRRGIRFYGRTNDTSKKPDESTRTKRSGLNRRGTQGYAHEISNIQYNKSHIYIVTCTAFPYVTLHSQPFPITRLVAVLCCTCYFVPPNGLG